MQLDFKFKKKKKMKEMEKKANFLCTICLLSALLDFRCLFSEYHCSVRQAQRLCFLLFLCNAFSIFHFS